MEFKVGDKVKIVEHRNAWWNFSGKMDRWMGKTMTVRKADPACDSYRMEEDKNENGSNGWSWDAKDFEKLVSSPCANKILITSDGHTTTARLYDGKKVTKSAEAKCAPDDKFDFVTGAKLAFDRLMGTEKPKEAKPEPVKLYCVKEYEPGEFLTRGKVYEIPHDGGFIPFDDGWRDMISFAETRLCGELVVPTYLVPLVSRPAKVGEWVYVLKDNGGLVIPGSVWKVRGMDRGGLNIENERGGYRLDHSNYLVLSGYDGRYEEQEKPTYYNGKVVCVKNTWDGTDEFFTPGKVYEFKNGVIQSNTNGKGYNWTTPIKSLNEITAETWGTSFIEYKGEADAK